MAQPYKTIAAAASDEFVEKKSRFIGFIAPVTTEEEAVAFINSIREKHREATHNVYAYVLRDRQLQRFSDDGEPQGTAGRPVLEVLLREQLVDVAVVVTRYFGGVLLGAGGLVRAYTQGAKCAVDAAEVLHMCPAVELELNVDYSFYGKLTYLLPSYGAVVRDTRFGQEVAVTLLLRQERLPRLEKELRELSSGTVAPVVLKQLWSHFDTE